MVQLKKTMLLWENYGTIVNYGVQIHLLRPRWLSGRTFVSNEGDQGSIPVHDIPKSLQQVVVAPLPGARQQVSVTYVLGDNKYNKRMPRVTVDMAR